jgi:hypothetical protein
VTWCFHAAGGVAWAHGCDVHHARWLWRHALSLTTPALQEAACSL